jgi:hypothetical protein
MLTDRHNMIPTVFYVVLVLVLMLIIRSKLDFFLVPRCLDLGVEPPTRSPIISKNGYRSKKLWPHKPANREQKDHHRKEQR